MIAPLTFTKTPKSPEDTSDKNFFKAQTSPGAVKKKKPKSKKKKKKKATSSRKQQVETEEWDAELTSSDEYYDSGRP